jgi:hypothetical protein
MGPVSDSLQQLLLLHQLLLLVKQACSNHSAVLRHQECITARRCCLYAVVCAAVIQVHTGDVELSIEGSGAPLRMAAPLVNGKVHVGAIREALAAKRLSLVTINGKIPVPDSGDFTLEAFSPGDTVTIEAAPKPGVCGGGLLQEGGLRGHNCNTQHHQRRCPGAHRVTCLLYAACRCQGGHCICSSGP